MTVLLFHQRFWEPLQRKTKRQTIRANRKVPIRAGDELDFRGWSGKPYRSEQVKLGRAACGSVASIWVDVMDNGELSIVIDEVPLLMDQVEELARADSFDGADDMARYYLERVRAKKLELPFTGVLVRW